ncbi:MAG: hypothetical protein Q8S36_08360 [Sulfuricurvum sp.]|nr:hypothetical protein [Sulfuricurvum sp.]
MIDQNFYDEVRNALLEDASMRKKLFHTVPYYEALRREDFTADNPQFSDEIYLKHSWLMGFLEYDETSEEEQYLELLLGDTTDIIKFMDGLFDTVEIWRSRKEEPKPREQRAQTNDIKSLKKALKVFEFLSLNSDTNPHFKSMANVYPERGEYCLKDVYHGIEWLKKQIEVVNGNAKLTVSNLSYDAHFQYCYNEPSYDKLDKAIQAFIGGFEQVTAISPNGEKELIDHYIYSDEAIDNFTKRLIEYLKTIKLL